MRRSRASCAIWSVFLGMVVLAVIVEGSTMLRQAREFRVKYPRLRIEAVYTDGKPCRGLGVDVAYGKYQNPLHKETDLRGVASYNVPLSDSNINVSFVLGANSALEPSSVHLDSMPAEGYTIRVTVVK
jgi:hypothetical protein